MDDVYTGEDFGKAFTAHFGLPPSRTANLRLATSLNDFFAATLTLMLGPEDLEAIGRRMRGEVPAKTSIGELTVKLDTSLVQGAIREILEPGAVYLPASAVEKLKRFGYVNVDKMAEFGGIVASEVQAAPAYEDAVAAGRKVVHVDAPDADDKVRFAWVYEGGCSDAQRVFAISTETDAGRTKYAIPVDHLTAHQMQDAKIETL